MSHKILGFRIWVIVMLAGLLGTSCAPAASPSVGSVVKIESSASSVQVNETVKMSIKVENITDLIAFEIHLSFDANMLEVVEMINGDFVQADFSAQNTFDNTAGTIDYAIAQIDREPARGSGTLFEIVFRAKTAGESLIHFRKTQAAPTGILLSDPNGMAIQVLLTEGSLNIK